MAEAGVNNSASAICFNESDQFAGPLSTKVDSQYAIARLFPRYPQKHLSQTLWLG
jgi:hypothetical protein